MADAATNQVKIFAVFAESRLQVAFHAIVFENGLVIGPGHRLVPEAIGVGGHVVG